MHAGSHCIVVAEDDPLLRYCTVKLLENEGYKVIGARDGVEALELLDNCDDTVHLLVTDYDMPRMNGQELARRLKAKHERLMVLVISGNDSDFEQANYIERLPKPFSQAELARRVRRLLRGSSPAQH